MRNRLHLMRIEKQPDPEDGASDFEGVPDEWDQVAEVYASIEPLRGREQLHAQQMESRVSHRHRMTYIAGIKPQMRGVVGSRVFHFETVMNVAEQRRTLEVMSQEVL